MIMMELDVGCFCCMIVASELTPRHRVAPPGITRHHCGGKKKLVCHQLQEGMLRKAGLLSGGVIYVCLDDVCPCAGI